MALKKLIIEDLPEELANDIKNYARHLVSTFYDRQLQDPPNKAEIKALKDSFKSKNPSDQLGG